MSRFSGVIAMAGICLVPLLVSAQPRGFNYDESKVPSFELPRSLLTNGGELVDSARQWQCANRFGPILRNKTMVPEWTS